MRKLDLGGNESEAEIDETRELNGESCTSPNNYGGRGEGEG